MLKRVQLFLEKVRQKLFEWRLEAEIYGRIFPHLKKQRDCGYSFSSEKEFKKVVMRGHLDLHFDLPNLEAECEEMPDAYSKAFRLILYRDLNRRLKMYQTIACRRVQPKTVDPGCMATVA